MIGLGTLWYSNYAQSSFHFIDDSKEWNQMDKVGHFVTSYYLNNIGTSLFIWSGVERNKSIWLGGTVTSLFLLSIEVFDGHSSRWGASWGDLAANTAGRLVGITQNALWDEQRIVFKFSFYESNLAQYRPKVLGENLAEQILKDYNGQTYWASVNIHSFLKDDSTFPKWLNVALGYGADGMTGGEINQVVVDGVILPEFQRQRQYYLSLDVDLTKIPTKSKVLKAVFQTFGFLKLPFPTLEYNDGLGMRYHLLYF
ncbi:MAG TPA: DUF2279 domain-containing protein [Flavobacteriales bacterium]|nr:DUF2279 domain-containing protein [Flavobacteriales bacterium]